MQKSRAVDINLCAGGDAADRLNEKELQQVNAVCGIVSGVFDLKASMVFGEAAARESNVLRNS